MKSIKIIVALVAFTVLCGSNSFAASISGKVVYDGDVPKFKPIKMDADPICLTHHKDEVVPQTLMLGENKEMANVFVHITAGVPKKDYPVPTEPVIIDQLGCMYNPHVVGVRVGQTVKILNPDGTLHNVHSMSKNNPEFNLAMPKFRKEVTKVFDKEEFMFAMRCDVHPWMGAWVTVLNNPYFNVTKTDGLYTINDLPAGEYEIEAWHEKLGVMKEKVILADGEAKEINFTFSKPSKE